MHVKGFIRKEEDWVKREISSLWHFQFLFRFHYPKLALFVLCIILTYLIFTDSIITGFLGHLQGWGYLGVLFAGILFSFGFTSPFSAGLLLLINPENIFLAAIIGGFGCLLGDLAIFKFVQISFAKEFARLKKERPFKFMKS